MGDQSQPSSVSNSNDYYHIFPLILTIVSLLVNVIYCHSFFSAAIGLHAVKINLMAYSIKAYRLMLGNINKIGARVGQPLLKRGLGSHFSL